MLDLAKLAGQIPGISKHLKAEAMVNRRRWELAQSLLEKAKSKTGVFTRESLGCN